MTFLKILTLFEMGLMRTLLLANNKLPKLRGTWSFLCRGLNLLQIWYNLQNYDQLLFRYVSRRLFNPSWPRIRRALPVNPTHVIFLRLWFWWKVFIIVRECMTMELNNWMCPFLLSEMSSFWSKRGLTCWIYMSLNIACQFSLIRFPLVPITLVLVFHP